MQKNNPQAYPPDHIRDMPDKVQKFYMNQVKRQNAHKLGPWLTQTKQTLMVKLVNYQGKSIGLQIAVP